MHFGSDPSEEIQYCFMYSIDLKTNTMKLRCAQNPSPHGFIFLAVLWFAVLDFKLFMLGHVFIFCYFNFSFAAKVITFSVVTLDLTQKLWFFSPFLEIGRALERAVLWFLYGPNWCQAAGHLDVSFSVATGAFLSLSLLLLSSSHVFLSPHGLPGRCHL